MTTDGTVLQKASALAILGALELQVPNTAGPAVPERKAGAELRPQDTRVVAPHRVGMAIAETRVPRRGQHKGIAFGQPCKPHEQRP